MRAEREPSSGTPLWRRGEDGAGGRYRFSGVALACGSRAVSRGEEGGEQDRALFLAVVGFGGGCVCGASDLAVLCLVFRGFLFRFCV